MNTTNSTPGDPCDHQQLSQGSKAVLGSVLVVIAVLGSVGNSILGIYVIRHTEMQSLINILLATMAVADTSSSLLCAPFDLFTILSGTWMFGQRFCYAHTFALSVLVVLNVIILVVISLDRYCILVHRKTGLRKCRPWVLVSGCVLFSAGVSCPPLFDVGKSVFASGRCRQVWGVDDPAYSMLFSGFLFVLPCGLLLLGYVHIIVAIRKSVRRVRPQLQRTSGNDAERSLRINVKFKRKTFSTILWLYAAAVICRLPLAVSVFFQSVAAPRALCPALLTCIVLLTYLNSAVNPFIYALKINEYLLMLTGKLSDVKNQVRGFKRRRSRSQPQNIYMVNVDSSVSVV